MPGSPASPGLRESWWVACEDPERGEWVTWACYGRDSHGCGGLSYDAGDYFAHGDPAANRRGALASLADRAGASEGVAELIAARVISGGELFSMYPRSSREDLRMARHLARWATRR
jgi:hypothetical protein